MAFEWPLWSSFVPDQWCLPWLSREETGSEWRGEMLQATKGVSKVFFPSYSSTLGSSGHHKSCLNLLFRAPPLCVCLCVYERERERACVFISPLQILLLKWLDNFVRHPRLPRSSAFLYYSFSPLLWVTFHLLCPTPQYFHFTLCALNTLKIHWQSLILELSYSLRVKFNPETPKKGSFVCKGRKLSSLHVCSGEMKLSKEAFFFW